MSNTISFNPICLLLSVMLILSSCSIQKRRYSRGWAVDLSLFKPPMKDKQSNKAMHNRNNKQDAAATILNLKASNHFAENPKTNNSPNNKIGLCTTQNRTSTRTNAKKIELDSNSNGLFKPTEKPNTKTDHPLTQHQNMNNKPKRNMALMIGASLLLMAMVAAFFVPIISGMFVLGNPALTALNVTTHFGKYIAGVIGWIVILVLDVLVSLGVYKYYKKERPKMAITSGLLRFVYSAFLGVAIVQLLKVTVSTPAIAIYNHISAFNSIWSWGLIVFGLHLIFLGILYNNEGGKKWLNIVIKTLLIAAGIGYIIVHVGMLIAPNPVAFAALIEPIFLIPMILGEIFFAIWLLVKGGKK